MKHLYYCKTLGDNPKKHEVSMEEIVSIDEIKCGFNEGMRPFTKENNKIANKKVCKYFVKEKYCSDDPEDLQRWVEEKRSESCRRNFHVLREINTRTGENKVICKALGDLFVICGKAAYKIVFVNEVRIKMVGTDRVRRDRGE